MHRVSELTPYASGLTPPAALAATAFSEMGRNEVQLQKVQIHPNPHQQAPKQPKENNRKIMLVFH